MKVALDELSANCPYMKRAYALCGAPEPRVKTEGYASLLRAIVDQQVSVQSGAAIWRRLEEGMAEITPSAIIDTDDNKLRLFGFSRPKARYARCLAEAIMEGRLDLAAVRDLHDNEAISALTSVTGIGRWTAEIYLMFALGRPDILPNGDIALATAAQRLFELPQRPNPTELAEIAERWKPWRSTAALMLWHFYKRNPLT